MRIFAATLVLLLSTASAADDRHVQIDSAGPAKFYLTSCTANPRSVMGTIPAGTRLRVVDETGCRRIVSLGPDGKRKSARLAYVLPYYKVEWEGSTVWISSGTTEGS